MTLDFALFLSVLIFSVVVHEVAHAWQAYREGDPTAHELGRITLNPLPHLDFFGSFLIPAFLFFSNAGILFGWAKPVPVDPSRFREHPWGDIRVSMAGIVSNLILAVLFTGVAVLAVSVIGDGSLGGVLRQAAVFGVFINLLLAFFNLIPIPPLDGSHVVAHLLPPRWRAAYQRAGRFGVPLLFVLVLVFPQVLGMLLFPVTWLMGLVDGLLRIWA